MALTLDGSNGITFPNATVQNNAVANNAAVLSLIGSRGIPTSYLGSNAVLQTVISVPDPGPCSVGSASWTEVSSACRITVTPISATSTLVIQLLFVFGGNFTNVLSHFKLYDITNSADLNLASNSIGSRTAAHGVARQVDSDANDCDMMVLSVSTPANNTTARTYGFYTKNESGTNAKYFFANQTNAVALVLAKPVFMVYELGA